jgi:Protein of unknown function with HXXEE motif
MWLWWAPLIAAALHVTEEFALPGGFGAWDRAYRPAIRSSITPQLHVVVNLLLLALCASVGLSGLGETGATLGSVHFRSPIPAPLAAASWVALAALLFSNAVFHIIGTIQSRRYSPGLITGVLLYMPLALFGGWRFIHGGGMPVLTAVAAVAVGGSYHVWASIGHGLRVRGEAAQQ